MKRAKLIPSILMLVLCTAVLAVGIYAASPTSHSIVGTVKITAGGANVSITGYLDDGDGDFTDDVKVTDTYTSRTSQTINIYANALDFDCSSAFDISEVAEKKLYFKVDNLSSYSLGAYFLEGSVSGETTSDNIAESKNFDGTMGTETISNLITATFSEYSEVPVNGSAYMYSTLKLNQLNTEASTVTLNLNLNIEKFNEELMPNYENTVQVKNPSGVNVSVACELQNASTTSTSTISNFGVWEIGGLAFSNETFGGQLRLPTIKVSMAITNNSNTPISVTLSEGNANVVQDSSKILVTLLGNPYIAPNKTGEVSVQFSAIYDRTSETPTAPTIETYNYKVSISKVDTAEPTLSRVKYDATGISDGVMKYYVEFGDNPYYTEGSTTHREKLRWYIWGKDDGNGNPEALEPGKDYNATTDAFIGGATYYFISETALELSESINDIPFQNEYTSKNPYGYNASDYATSNVRNYLNGMVVKSGYSGASYSCFYANGTNVDFYNRYNFTNDELYGLIAERSLSELYEKGANNNINELPSAYSAEADKFWLISYSEWQFIDNLDSTAQNVMAKHLNGVISYWSLRTPSTNGSPYYVEQFAAGHNGGMASLGVRPAFALAI